MSIFFAQPIEQFPKDLAFVTTPSATNADANFPAANLIGFDPTKAFKTTANSTVITWDFGLNREFDVVELHHCSFSYKALWIVEGSLNGTVWTTLRSSFPASAHLTSVPGSWSGEINDPRRSILNRNKALYNSATVQTFRYVRVTVTGDATLDPTFTIGRLFVGKKFVPTTGWQYGSSITFTDPSQRERTERGALVTEPKDVIISASVKLDFLSKAEMYDYIYEFNFWRGGARELLACLDVEDTVRLQKNILYCTIAEGRTITYDAFNTHSQTWILESIV